jgi:hypothetical protein
VARPTGRLGRLRRRYFELFAPGELTSFSYTQVPLIVCSDRGLCGHRRQGAFHYPFKASAVPVQT